MNIYYSVDLQVILAHPNHLNQELAEHLYLNSGVDVTQPLAHAPFDIVHLLDTSRIFAIHLAISRCLYLRCET